MALKGRHGEAPLPVFAAAGPGDSFDTVLEAARVATTFMTPVILLSDAYTANAAEPWRLPDVDAMADIAINRDIDPEGFHPFRRDQDTLARAWAVPGMPGLAHRLGGIERSAGSGHISYDPDNHQEMTDLRAAKLDRIRDFLPAAKIETGDDAGRVLVVGWGSTRAIRSARRAACRCWGRTAMFWTKTIERGAERRWSNCIRRSGRCETSAGRHCNGAWSASLT